MKPVDNQTLLNQLNWRYATEKFDPARKISAEDWSTLEQALIATASSFGLQPWHFVVITSQKIKEQLHAVSWKQSQLLDASHVVVFAVKKGMDADYVQKHIDRTAEVRGMPVESLERYKRAMVGTITKQGPVLTDSWNSNQTYIALGNLLTCAALMGIDACPMEGIEPARYDQILELDKKGYATLMIAALGYRAADDPAAIVPKVRFKAEAVVTHID